MTKVKRSCLTCGENKCDYRLTEEQAISYLRQVGRIDALMEKCQDFVPMEGVEYEG